MINDGFKDERPLIRTGSCRSLILLFTPLVRVSAATKSSVGKLAIHQFSNSLASMAAAEGNLTKH
jgi:hypothetical protein